MSTVRTLTETPKPWVYIAERRRTGELVAVNSGFYPNENFFKRYAHHRIRRFDTEAEWLAYLKARKTRLL